MRLPLSENRRLEERRTPGSLGVISVILLGAIAAGVWFVYYLQIADTKEALQQTESAKRAIEQPADVASDRALALCARDDDVSRELHRAGVCRASEDVKQATKQRPEVIEGPRGPGPTREQIRQVVEEYCANGRCQGPKGEAPNIESIVDEVMDRIEVPEDGVDGKNATPEMVLAAVTAYCTGGGDPCRGPKGERGPQGEKGPAGEKGMTGPHWIPGAARFIQTNAGCVYQVTYHHSREEGVIELDTPVPPALCLGNGEEGN